MDYSYDTGMFTDGQTEVMRNNILEKRYRLLWKNNCDENSNNENELTTGFIKDSRDNQSYKWVQIGNQKWLTQNLNYKTQNSKCYDNKETNCTVYGRLYNWNDAIKVCPSGWRLPSKKDWDTLLTNIGSEQIQVRSKQGWVNYKNGTNSSGLNILPSGYKSYYLNYSGLGKVAKIWLNNSQGYSAYSRDIGGMRGYIDLPDAGIDKKRDYLSCRCIQDDKTINSSKQENNKPNSKSRKLYSRGEYPVKQKTQSNSNAKKLNSKTNNRTSQKKKGTTLKDLTKEN